MKGNLYHEISFLKKGSLSQKDLHNIFKSLDMKLNITDVNFYKKNYDYFNTNYFDYEKDDDNVISDRTITNVQSIMEKSLVPAKINFITKDSLQFVFRLIFNENEKSNTIIFSFHEKYFSDPKLFSLLENIAFKLNNKNVFLIGLIIFEEWVSSLNEIVKGFIPLTDCFYGKELLDIINKKKFFYLTGKHCKKTIFNNGSVFLRWKRTDTSEFKKFRKYIDSIPKKRLMTLLK